MPHTEDLLTVAISPEETYSPAATRTANISYFKCFGKKVKPKKNLFFYLVIFETFDDSNFFSVCSYGIDDVSTFQNKLYKSCSSSNNKIKIIFLTFPP